MRRLDKLDQPPRLPLDQSLLEPLEALAVELLARLGGPRQQPLEVHQVQPGGQLGQLLGVQSRSGCPSLPSWPSYQVANSSRAAASGIGDVERRHVRAADQAAR